MKGRLEADIAVLRDQRTTVATQVEALRRSLEAAISRDAASFDPYEERSARAAVAEAQTRLCSLTERIAALEARLPTQEVMEGANRDAEALLAQLREANARFTEASKRYCELLQPAQQSAQALIAARAECRDLTLQLEEIVRHYDLPVPVPTQPLLSPVSAKLGMLIGMFVSQAAHGEASDVLLRDLAAVNAEAS